MFGKRMSACVVVQGTGRSKQVFLCRKKINLWCYRNDLFYQH